MDRAYELQTHRAEDRHWWYRGRRTVLNRVIKDLDLTLMGMYGLVLTLFLACSAVPGEIERHTIYPLVARPLRLVHNEHSG